jgi:hypothetical protein
MMILKHGNLKPRKFVCDQCGCEFVANAKEYGQYKYEGKVLWTYADCPECDARISYSTPWEGEYDAERS